MENEGRKIMHHPAFRASVTCVRGAGLSFALHCVSAEFEKPVSVEAARTVLKKRPDSTSWTSGEQKISDALFTSEKIQLRSRPHPSGLPLDNGCVSGERRPLLKGAALNAVQMRKSC